MLDLEADAVAASRTVVDDPLARWRAGFEELFGVVAGRFAQVESRRRARLYLLGLLSGAERKKLVDDRRASRRAEPGRDAAVAELLPLGR